MRISSRGLWLRLDEQEHFVAFTDFPFFATAPVVAIFHVCRPSAGHIRWPDLDVDLELDSILEPGRYPLVSRAALPEVGERPVRLTRRRPAR